tara:strand:- start:3988 stop:4479 length:492 start_codon:yes stop_codon:yes gene_type:complete
VYKQKEDSGDWYVEDNREHLRIKVNHLAAESRIIRREENKLRTKVSRKHGTELETRENQLRLAKRLDKARRRNDSQEAIMLSMRLKLANHRRYVLRPAARSAGLALGFIKGRTLDEMERPRNAASLERKPYKHPDWKEIQRMCSAYGRAGWNGPEAAIPSYVK